MKFRIERWFRIALSVDEQLQYILFDIGKNKTTNAENAKVNRRGINLAEAQWDKDLERSNL